MDGGASNCTSVKLKDLYCVGDAHSGSKEPPTVEGVGDKRSSSELADRKEGKMFVKWALKTKTSVLRGNSFLAHKRETYFSCLSDSSSCLRMSSSSSAIFPCD